MILNDRDLIMLKEIGRWRFALGRHLKALADFSGDRACQRRLKLLLDDKYIERQKILYAMPYIYTLTHKSRILLNLNKRATQVSVSSLKHDIAVLDVLVGLKAQKKLELDQVVSAKEMHSLDGFGTSKHKPDFMFTHINKNNFFNKNQKVAVEVELSLKSLERLQNNVKDNYLNYDVQIWYIDRKNVKLHNALTKLKDEYANLNILFLKGE